MKSGLQLQNIEQEMNAGGFVRQEVDEEISRMEVYG